MNKIETVIENLVDLKNEISNMPETRFLISLEFAIEALQRQIPSKPKELTYKPLKDIGWKYECPSCGCAVGINNNAIDYTQEDEFCPSCGQKLDWK